MRKNKKFLKLTGIVLCLVMLCGIGIISSVTSSAASVVKMVQIYDIDAPNPGVKPDFSGTVRHSSYCIVQGEHGVYWYDDDNGNAWSCDSFGTFVKGRNYRVKVYIEPNAGYEFPESPSEMRAYFGRGDSDANVYKDSNGYYVQYYFDVCGTIETIELSPTYPVAGQKPDFTAVGDGRFYSYGNVSPEWNGIKWYDETAGRYLITGTTSAYFEAHHTYTIEYSLYTDDSEFGNASARVYGQRAILEWCNPYIVTVKYTFYPLCDPVRVAAKEPGCGKEGNKEYFACSCGNFFEDAGGTELIKDKTSVVIPATRSHSPKSDITKATTSKAGKIITHCTFCSDIISVKKINKIAEIKLSTTKYTYNGKSKKPSVIVKDSEGKELKKGTDFDVSYASGRKSTGKYSVKVTFKGNYSGKKTLYFKILPSKTSKIVVTQTESTIKAKWSAVTGANGYKVYLYKGSKLVASKVTKDKSYTFKKLSSGTAYKVVVKAYVTIDGEKEYSKYSKSLETATSPKAPVLKAKAGSKLAKLSWKKITGANGYIIEYSTSSSFNSAKSVTVKKGSSVSKTIEGLSKGKTYYFRIKAYKTVDSKQIYSDWSARVSAKIK